jgi:hypothetical protein
MDITKEILIKALLDITDGQSVNDLVGMTGLSFEKCNEIHNLTEKLQALNDFQFKFRNFYQCPRCDYKWEDMWDSTCDDECPECGNRDISPYESVDLSDLPD